MKPTIVYYRGRWYCGVGVKVRPYAPTTLSLQLSNDAISSESAWWAYEGWAMRKREWVEADYRRGLKALQTAGA